MNDTTRLDRIERAVEKLTSRQETLIKDLERYKGFWGGIMLACSAVWAFITLAVDMGSN